MFPLCRLTRVSDSARLRQPLLRRDKPRRRCSPSAVRRRPTGAVPQGHLPLYVGDEMVRFVVRADLLAHPAFAELLRRSAAVYGYRHNGALRIPCSVAIFEAVVDAICGGEENAAEAAVASALPLGTPEEVLVVL